MKAHMERDFVTQTVKVWVTTDDHQLLLRVTDYVDPVSWRWDQIKPGSEQLPTMVLPEPVLAAIVVAGAEVLPPDRAQAAHLADAIKMRDALLELVAGAHPRRP